VFNTSPGHVLTVSLDSEAASEAHRNPAVATKVHAPTGAAGMHGVDALSPVDREDKLEQERVLVELLVKADVPVHQPLPKCAQNHRAPHPPQLLPIAMERLIESTRTHARDIKLKTIAVSTNRGCPTTALKHAVLHRAKSNQTKTATVQFTTPDPPITAILNNS